MTCYAPAFETSTADRRTQILDAAERCFVSHGFHRTTMQDIATAAQMSVGNFYRYFPAKDAIVLGLAERDRAQAGRFLKDLEAGAPPWPAVVDVLRAHVLRSRREKAVLLVEIWAEATRNPKIAAMDEQFDRENRAWLVAALRAVTASPAPAVGAIVDLILTHVRGIMVARALSAAYDPEPSFDALIALAHARLIGQASCEEGAL